MNLALDAKEIPRATTLYEALAHDPELRAAAKKHGWWTDIITEIEGDDA